MADGEAAYSPLISGASTEQPPPPERGLFGWARDTGIDIGRGALGIARDVTGAKAAISTAAPPQLGMDTRREQENLRALEDVDRWLKSGKTETGRYREEHPPGWLEAPVGKATEAIAGIVPYAPIAMTGPAAPAIFGALGYGHAQSEMHERLRDMSEADLMQSPDYKRYRDTGMDDQAARDQLFVDAADPTKLKNLLATLPSVAGNVIGGGLGGVALSKAAQRTISETITERVLRNVNASGLGPWAQRRAVGAAGGATAGAAMAGGTDVTGQMMEQNVGLRRDIDYGQAARSAAEGAAPFAVLGALTHGRRMPGRAEPGAAPKPVAPDIGTDVNAVATSQQQQPPAGRPEPPQAPPPPPPGPPQPPRPTAPAPYPTDIERAPSRPAVEPWPDTGGIGPGYEPAPPRGIGRRPQPQPGEPGGPPVTIPGGRFEDMPPMPVPARPETERPGAPAFPEIERPGWPEPGEFGGEAEPELSYPDRAKLRQALRTMDPQERGQLADTLERALDRGVRPSIGLPEAGLLDQLIQSSPRGVLGELRRGIEQQAGIDRLDLGQRDAINRVMDRNPDATRQWASEVQRTLDTGARTVMWNRLPKSMRDALGPERATVMEALRRNPREVVDTLAGREHAPEAPRYREAGTRDVVERPAPAAEPTAREEPHGIEETQRPEGGRPQREVPPEVWQGLEAEGEARRLEAEYGPAAEHEEPYLTRRHRRGRVGTERDIGLTRAGTFTEETRPHMQGQMGRTLTIGGPRTETRGAAILRRAAERRAERQRAAEVRTGNIRAPEGVVHETRVTPEPGVEHIEPVVRRHKERMAEEEARRHLLQRDVAEQQQAREGRRAVHETVETIARFREVASREFQRAIDRIPFVRDMARAEAREQARLDRDANRKRRTRRGDLEYRERVVGRVLRDEHTDFVQHIDDLIREGTQPISPTGQRYTATAREAAGETPGRLGGDITRLDQVSREALFAAGRRLAEAMKGRVANAKEALDVAMVERTPRGQKPRIGWGVPTVRSGLHPWYDRLADLNRYGTALNREIAKGNTEVVRGMMTNVWLREHMLKAGRIAEWDEYLREKQQLDYNDVVTQLRTKQRQLDEREAPGSEHFDPREESRLRSEINELTQLMHSLEDIGSKDPVDFELQMMEREDQLGKMLREHQRRIVLDWVRDRLSGQTEEQRIESQRDIERQRRATEIRNQERETPRTPTRFEQEQRMRALEDRAEQISQALDAVPTDHTGRVREIVAALHEVVRKPGEERQPITRPQMTEARLNDYYNRLQEEMRQNETEQRDLATQLNPRMLQDEYGLRGVLDPAADLTRRSNLPQGSYARRVTDYLKGKDSLRPSVGGSVLDAKGRPQFRPGEPAARIINHYLDVIDQVSGDAHVVTLSDEQMVMAARQRGLPADTPAFYDVRTHRILINRSSMNGPERTRVLMHEFGHPMIEAAVQRFPEIARRLDSIRKIVHREWAANHPGVSEALGYNTQGLTNVHEFLTELYSDGGRMASALHAIETTSTERAALETARGENLLARTLKTLKRGLTNLFFSVSKKRLLNDATINSLELFESIRRQGRVRPRPEDIARPITREEAVDWARQRGADAQSRWETFKTYLKSGDLSMSLHNLSDMERRGSAGLQPLTTRVSQIMDRRNATGRRIEQERGTEDIAARISDMERVNHRAYEQLQDLVDQVTHWGLAPDEPLHEGRNAHVSRDAVRHQQLRDVHPDMQRRWNELTDVQKQLFRDQRQHYEQRHDQMLHAMVGQLVDSKKLINEGAPERVRTNLMRYIIDGEKAVNEADTAEMRSHIEGFGDQKFRNDIEGIRRNRLFRKLPNWFPAMRRGQWVVEGKYNLERHIGNGTQLDRPDGAPSGQFEFNTAAERDAFIQRVNNDPAFQGVRLLDTSDIVYAKDEAGNIMRDANGKPVPLTEYAERTRTKGEELEPGYREETISGVARRVRPKDAGDEGITRYRVEYNPQVLEFFEHQREAQAKHMELRSAAERGDMALAHAGPVRDFKNSYVDPAKSDRMFRQMQDSLVNSKGWRDMDESTRAQVLNDLREASIRSTMSSSARANYLPRRFALGQRKDMLRNFLEYNRNTAHTLAGLQHRAELADALKAMDEHVKANRYWGSPNDPQGQFGITDERVRRSMHERAMQTPNEFAAPNWTKKLTTVLRLSYLDKLMSPMFTTLQLIEPWTISAPVLAGRFGGAKAGLALTRALSDLGGLRMALGGVPDMIRTARAGPFAQLKQTDMVGKFKDRVAHDAEAVDLLDHMERHSQLDRNAGLELGAIYNPAGGRGAHVLDWADHMTRQVNSQVEGFNRASVGLAAYRLAREGGMSIDAAKEYARKTVHETAGNYNSYASAPLFNKPWLRPALQFKRYAQRMTSHWIRSVYNAFANLPPEEQAVARRQLAYMVGSAVFSSGFLGLPTEPIKALINATAPITGFDSDDAERAVYEASLDILGPDMGEFLSRGAFRYAGIGMGQRIGYDSLWTFGAPGRRTSDWYQSAGHFIAGAPGSYAVDAAQGLVSMANMAGHLVNGRNTEAEHEFYNAIEKTFPVKTVADILGAARRQVGGPQFRTLGGVEQGYQPEEWETAMQAFGVQSARQQRAGEKRQAMKTDLRNYQSEHKNLGDMYARADNPSERAAIVQSMRQFNERWPEMKPMTIGDLIKARARHEAAATADPSMLGITMTRRQQALLPRYSMYNVQ